jgi:hypothetical protein
MTDRGKSNPSPSADRTRRYRDRQRRGLMVLVVEVDEVETADALIAAGYLAPHHADDRQKIAEAAQRARVVLLPHASRVTASDREA